MAVDTTGLAPPPAPQSRATEVHARVRVGLPRRRGRRPRGRDSGRQPGRSSLPPGSPCSPGGGVVWSGWKAVLLPGPGPGWPSSPAGDDTGVLDRHWHHDDPRPRRLRDLPRSSASPWGGRRQVESAALGDRVDDHRAADHALDRVVPAGDPALPAQRAGDPSCHPSSVRCLDRQWRHHRGGLRPGPARPGGEEPRGLAAWRCTAMSSCRRRCRASPRASSRAGPSPGARCSPGAPRRDRQPAEPGRFLTQSRELQDTTYMIALMITILVIGIAVDAVFAAVDRGSGPAVVSRRADQATTVLRGPRMGKIGPWTSRRGPTTRCERCCPAAAQVDRTGPVSAEAIASRQALPKKFLEAILSDLRRSGLVTSTRGQRGRLRWRARLRRSPRRRLPGR